MGITKRYNKDMEQKYLPRFKRVAKVLGRYSTKAADVDVENVENVYLDGQDLEFEGDGAQSEVYSAPDENEVVDGDVVLRCQVCGNIGVAHVEEDPATIECNECGNMDWLQLGTLLVNVGAEPDLEDDTEALMNVEQPEELPEEEVVEEEEV